MSDDNQDQEFPIPDDYQEYLPGDRVSRQYDYNAHIYRSGVCNLNPLLSEDARAAVKGRIQKVIPGSSKSTAQIFARLITDDSPGNAVSGVDSTLQFTLREQIEDLGITIPKGKMAVVPCQVVKNSRLGPMLAFDCKKPEYVSVPPRTPRQKRAEPEAGQTRPDAAGQQGPAAGQVKPADGKAAPGQQPQT